MSRRQVSVSQAHDLTGWSGPRPVPITAVSRRRASRHATAGSAVPGRRSRRGLRRSPGAAMANRRNPAPHTPYRTSDPIRQPAESASPPGPESSPAAPTCVHPLHPARAADAPPQIPAAPREQRRPASGQPAVRRIQQPAPPPPRTKPPNGEPSVSPHREGAAPPSTLGGGGGSSLWPQKE